MNGRTAKATRREVRHALAARPRGMGEVFGCELDKWAGAEHKVKFAVRRRPWRRKHTVVVVFRAVSR